MSEILKINQVTEEDLRGKKIAELSDRPNQPSGFGPGLTAQELKERFDAFPAEVKDKIEEIIEMLSSEDATDYFGIESPIYKNLHQFLSLFGEKDSADDLNIIDFIYAKYALEYETSKRWHSLRWILDQIKADIAELKAGVPPPDDGGDDEGGTTPPEGGDSGGTTTPPEGGGDGEEDGGDEPPVYTEDVEYNGVSEAVVPSNALTTASLLNIGGLSKISKNYANYSEVITLEYGASLVKRVVLECNQKYMFSFEIVGTVVNTSFLSVLFQDNSATTTYTHELNVFALESSIICEYTFDYLESVQLKITMKNNSQSSLVFKNISLTKFADGRSDMDFAMIGSNSVKRIRHQKNVVIKDVLLPNVVRSNPIFGHGFGLYTNRYIVEDGVLEENVKVVKGSELTWTLTLAGSPKSYYAYAGLPSPCIDHVVECSPLAPRVFTGASEDIGIDVVTQNGRSFVVISLGASYTSVEDLAQNSTFIYALKEPNKIQIADGIDGLIDVEPNGVIQTLNENGEQVKSNFAVRYVLQE